MSTPEFCALEYPLVCFDLDGTLVDDTIYIWKTLHRDLKTDGAKRKKAQEDFFAKKITYAQWFNNDLKLMREAGAVKSAFIKILNTLKPMQGAKKTLQTLKANGHKIAVISGSLDIVVDHLFADFAFDHILINKIYFNKNGTIKGGTPTMYDMEGKANGLEELCQLENITTAKAAFIGDNINDIHIAKAAGFSIAFNCKSPLLSQICNVEIHQKDMTKILKHFV